MNSNKNSYHELSLLQPLKKIEPMNEAFLINKSFLNKMKVLSDSFKKQPTMEKIRSLTAWDHACFPLTVSAYTTTFTWTYCCR